MASMILSSVGNFILPGIGGIIGGYVGSMIDRKLFGPEAPKVFGPRLNDLTVQTSTEGASLPIVYGTMRLAGNVIWSTGLEEVATTTEAGGGSGGGGGSSTTYSYRTDCAVAVCEGTITGIRRIWADTKLIYDVGDSASIETLMASGRNDIRFYTGSETQLCDTLTQAVTGSDLAYRGTAYVVFENLELANFGNRLPNFSFEVVKSGSLSSMVLKNSSQYPSMPQANYTRNAPYIAAEGLYIWTRVDNSLITIDIIPTGSNNILRYKTLNINTSNMYAPSWLGVNYICAGTSDINATAIGIKNGSLYGIAIIDEFGSYKEILPNTAAVSASCCTIKNNKLYFICGYAASTKLYSCNLDGTNLAELVIPLVSTLIADTNWVGVSDKYLYMSSYPRLIYYDINSLVYLGEFNITAYNTIRYEVNVTPDDYIIIGGTNPRIRNFFTSDESQITSGISNTSGASFYHYIPYLSNKKDMYSYWGQTPFSNQGFFNVYISSQLTQGIQTVKEVVEDISNKSGIPSTKYNYSALNTDIVRGYIVSRVMSGKAALDSLEAAYSFDTTEEAGTLIAKKKINNVNQLTLTTSLVGTEQK